jgi:hypothetical protein
MSRTRRPTDEVIVSEETLTTRQWWLWGFCCIVIVALVIFFIVSIVYWSRWNTWSSWSTRMDQIVSELSDENSFQTDIKNMVSFSSLAITAFAKQFSKPKKVSLCYADFLQSDTPDGKSPLTVVENQLLEDKDPYTYVLDLKLSMEFDVDVRTYLPHGDSLTENQRWMTLTYLITSTYTRFTTIKLVESALDNKNQALVKVKEIVLCSNNPTVSTRICGGVNDGESGATSLFVEGTKIVVMSRMNPWLEEGKNTSHGKPKALVSKSDQQKQLQEQQKQQETLEQFDLAHSDGTFNKYRIEKDFTKDVRLYNVVFYQLHPSLNEESVRYSNYKEVPVLSIKPSKCK